MSIERLATNDSGFIFDPATGSSFTANKTAVFIIRQIQEGIELKEIAQRLIEKFDDANGDVEHDVEDFIEHLKILGLTKSAS